jgi:fatty acid desaturase
MTLDKFYVTVVERCCGSMLTQEDCKERTAIAAFSRGEAAKCLGRFATPSSIHGLYRICKAWATIIFVFLANATASPADISLRALVYLLSILLVGRGLKNLESCTHEASHRTLFKVKCLNDWLEFLFALPVLEPVAVYRRHHLIHHAEFGRPTDPAVQLYAESGILDFPRGFIVVMVVRPLLGFSTLQFLKEISVGIGKDRISALKLALFWAPILVFVYQMNLLFWFFAYFMVPLFFIFPILLFWGEVLDHAGLEWSSTLSGTRTNLGLIAGMIYPGGEGYHLVHHLHPGVPNHRLAEAHLQLLTIPLFRDSSIICSGILASVRSIKNPSYGKWTAVAEQIRFEKI